MGILPHIQRGSISGRDEGIKLGSIILQVEDSENDALLLSLAFQKAGVTNPIITVQTGWEALCYFHAEGIYADREQYPLPRTLLLDLKLPGMTGFDLLESLRKESLLNDVLVVAISGYNEINEVRRAYALGVRTLLTKPILEKDVADLVKAFSEFSVSSVQFSAALRSCEPPNTPNTRKGQVHFPHGAG